MKPRQLVTVLLTAGLLLAGAACRTIPAKPSPASTTAENLLDRPTGY